MKNEKLNFSFKKSNKIVNVDDFLVEEKKWINIVDNVVDWIMVEQEFWKEFFAVKNWEKLERVGLEEGQCFYFFHSHKTT